MPSPIQSYLLQGIDAVPCEVEVDLDATGMDRQTIVGLPDAAVKESFERVRSALNNSGYTFPLGRLLVNLAPADVKKEGPLYDLPIALGMLMVQGVVRSDGAATRRGDEGKAGLGVAGFLVAGELALDGRIRPIRGAIAMAALAHARAMRGVIVPAENAAEAAVVAGIEVIGVRTLAELVGVLSGQIEPSSIARPDVPALLSSAHASVDFAEVRGQESVKRALVIAAAGSHNLVMVGPAGTGKTMMAKALPGILPPLTPEEAIDVTRIYSAAGQLPPGRALVTVRPVRTPHHTASAAAIVGGGIVPRPGEISLAHHGVLFLDELPEFPRDVLETLRQPLEDHVVTIARSRSAVRFPADFMLVAAMNPTPKGDVAPGEVGRRAMEKYLGRLSGPLLDRIDIHVEAPAVPWAALASAKLGASTEQMRAQVLAARRRAAERFGGVPNARLTGRQLDQAAVIDGDARSLFQHAIVELGLSARAYDKIRRVARTIADLDGADALATAHIAEAVQYRFLDRRV